MFFLRSLILRVVNAVWSVVPFHLYIISHARCDSNRTGTLKLDRNMHARHTHSTILLSLSVWDCADKIDYDFPYYYEYDYDCDNNHYHNPVVLQRVPQPWTEWDKNRKRDKFQMWMRIRVWTVFVCLLLNVTVVFLFISSASGDTVSTSASVLLANFTEYLCVCCMYIEVCKPLLKFLLTVHGSLW